MQVNSDTHLASQNEFFLVSAFSPGSIPPVASAYL